MYPFPYEFPMDTLRTPRLIIRRLSLSDAADVYAYSRDEEVARHVLWMPHKSVGESRSYIRSIQHKYRAGEPTSWGIEYRENRRIIGTIGYMWHQSDNSAAEIGYSLARAYWNQGIMTEALRAVIAYSFDRLRINRLEAQHEVNNPASGMVMSKAGMSREGLLRERLYNKGRYVDVVLYSILRSEYASRTRYAD